MRSEALDTLLPLWADLLKGASPRLALALFVPLAALVVLRLSPLRQLVAQWAGREVRGFSLPSLLVLGLALVVGLRGVFDQQSLFDDAYISLRYASNFAEGNGLVWNLGERVEGYTNFLWTVLIALFLRLTSVEAPLIALGLCWFVFVLNLVVAARLEARVLRTFDAPVPVAIAPLLLAMHSVFLAYGSTGMETGLCALWVSLAALALCGPWSGRAALLAGGALIAATLTRPDHALFYVVGAAVVVFQELSLLWQSRARGEALPLRASLRRASLYAAPFAVYLAYLGWKLQYYGELLPNTYYAKSADMDWYEQGRIYLLLFVIATSALVPLGLIAVAGLRLRSRGMDAWTRLLGFTAGSTVLYCLYVAKVGGDFMHGRFLVSLVPIVYICASVGVHSLAPREGGAAALGRWLPWAVAAGVLLASLQPLPLFDRTYPHFGVVDESSYYPVTRLRPEVRVNHNHWAIGTFIRDRLVAQGIEPIIGTGGIGMVGYYSRLRLIDVYGLTDATVAHRELGERLRPGHEKIASRGYLRKRDVQLLRRKAGQHRFHPKRFRKISRIRFGEIQDPWQLARYDRELIAELRAKVPELHIRDFEKWLDSYIAHLPERSVQEVADDLRWFRRYYFDHNDDPKRLRAIMEHR
jgi:hypothetical protein